jgi:cysteine desulfurase
MPSAPIYLDHLATTPTLPEALEAMRPFLEVKFGSAGSIHQLGLAARDALNEARARFAAFVRAESPDDIIFTSSGTEAINLAIKGLAWHPRRKGTHIVCSAIEHPAVLGAIEFLKRDGITSTRVPVNRWGKINSEQVRAAITDQTFLVAVHAANYDIGTIQPLTELGGIARETGVAFLVEANYAGGWLPLDVQAQGIDLLTLAPHRFHGPKGVGVLYRNRRARLIPLVHGGSQEGGLRAGAENVPAIVGAGVAAEIAERELDQRVCRIRDIQSRLWSAIEGASSPVELYGPVPGPERLATHLNIAAAGTEGEGLMLMCDAQRIAIGSGTACTLKVLKSSPVLDAIGVSADLARAAVLISPGKDTTVEEADRFVAVFGRMVQRLRDMSPGWEKSGR